MARMSLSAVVLCRQRLRPPPSMEQSEGSGCADSPPSSHVATAVISGLQTLLLFAVASISDHCHHQRTISSAPVPCRLRTAASTMTMPPPGAGAITRWRQMMTAKRKAVRGGTQNSLSVRGCGADAFLSAAMTPRYAWQVRACRETGGSIAQAIRHARPVFTVARRRQPCRHCIVCAVAPDKYSLHLR